MRIKNINLQKQLFFLLVLLLFTFPNYMAAQVEESSEATEDEYFEPKEFDWSRVRISPDIGLSFTSDVFYGNIFYLRLAPYIGYEVVEERLETGIGTIYQYVSFSRINQKTHAYGGSIYSRFYILEQLFAHVELNQTNVEYYSQGAGGGIEKGRKWFPNVFAGAGYRSRIGANSFANIIVMVNLIENELNPQRRPFFTGGFSFGL